MTRFGQCCLLARRLVEAGVDATKLWTANLNEADWGKISHAVGRLADAQLHIDDNPHCTVMEMRAKARRLRARYGDLGLVVVDYIQLMSPSSSKRSENRQVEVSEMSRGLKILARELECPVVALSQLNRQLEYRTDKRPMLADLRESGGLEQDADIVMFIYRDEVYNPESDDRGKAEVIIAKHRNGATGKAEEVVKLVAEAHTNKEIAELLGLSEKTVENHRSNAMRNPRRTNATAAALIVGAQMMSIGLIAEMITGATPFCDPAPYSVTRFGNDRLA